MGLPLQLIRDLEVSNNAHGVIAPEEKMDENSINQ